MSFAVPAALAMLLLVPVVIFFHLRKRRSVEVGSVMIWRRVMGGTQQPVTQLARPASWLPLVLQVMGIVALAVALARPSMGGDRSEHHVIVIDASLPMLARDVEPNRLVAALAEARVLMARATRDDRYSLVVVEGRARIVAASQPADSAMAHLQGWEQAGADDEVRSQSRADWRDVAEMVRHLRASSAASLHLWTSPQDVLGALEAFEGIEVADAPSVRVIGSSTGFFNAGFGEVQLMPRAGGDGRWTVEGELLSVGLAGIPISIRAVYSPDDLAGDLVWGATEVVPDRFGVGKFSLPVVLPGAGVLELQLTGGDHYALDDRMPLNVTERSSPTVLIVGPENLALDRALLSIANVAVYRSDDVPEDAAQYDLVIVDRATPSRSIPTSILWLSSPSPAAAILESPAGLSRVRPDAWLKDHPISREIDWGALELDVLGRLQPVGDGWETILSVQQQQLIAARTTRFGREVALSINAHSSAWLATAAFPTLIAGILDWSLPDAILGAPTSCVVAQPCGLPRAAFEPNWQLNHPDGSVLFPEGVVWDALSGFDVWLPGAFDRQFTPRIAGRYLLVQGEQTTPLLVRPTPLVDAGVNPAWLSDVGSTPALAPMFRWWPALAFVGLIALVLDVAYASVRRERWLPLRRWRVGEPRGRFVAITAFTILAAGAILLALVSMPIPERQRLQHDVLVRLGHSETLEVERRPNLARVNVVGVGGAFEPGAWSAPDLLRAFELARASSPYGLETRLALQIDASRYPFVGADWLTPVEAQKLTLVGVHWSREPEEPRVTIERVVHPEMWRAGDRGEVSLSAFNHTLDPVAIRLLIGGEEPIEVGQLSPGAGLLNTTVRAPREPGAVEWRLEVYSPTTATLIESLQGVFWIEAASRVLLVALDLDRIRPFAEVLRAQGVAVDVNLPRRLPGTLEALAAYQVVALVDVPAVAIHTFHQELLAQWVSERGGGVVILGGETAFGAGGYLLTPLDSMSPLSSKIPDEAPEVTMVFVLDRSGSMSARVGAGTRLQVAQEAAVAAFDLLNPDSLIGIIAFDAGAEVILPMVRASETPVLIEAVNLLRPGGGTDVYFGLLKAEELLQDVESSVLHVVVLTDGITQPGDFQSVLGRLRAMGVTTSFIGIGDGADQGQLRALADLGGGNLHFTRDFRALPAIMALETSMAASDAVERTVVQPTWLEPRPPFTLGLPSPAPALQGYVRTTLKPEANLHVSDIGLDIPLLASWRYGVGRVVAFASDPVGVWGDAWRSDAALVNVWPELLRWITSSVLRAGAEVTTWYDGATLYVRATIRDEDLVPLRGLQPTLSLRISNAWDAEPSEHLLHEVRDGVYQAMVVIDPSVVTLELTVAGGDGAPFYVREQSLVVDGPLRGTPPSQLATRTGITTALASSTVPVMTLQELDAALAITRERWGWGGDGAPWLYAAVSLWMSAIILRYGGVGLRFAQPIRWRALGAQNQGVKGKDEENRRAGD